MTKIAVILPYYQRQPGLLRAALDSALGQTSEAELEIIVVDDGSPAAAEPELSGLPLRPDRSIRLLKQPNRGAAAARNAGLAALDGRATFTAFLGSDDAWAPDHLQRALRALGDDADIFFANHRRHDQVRDVFAAMAYRPPSEPLGDGLHRHTGHFLEDLLRNRPIATPTLVIRSRCIGALRFPQAWQHAHEDLLFLIALAERTNRVAFSDREACACGAGVNIYYAAAKPQSRAAPRLAHDILRYIAVVSRRPDLTPAIHAHLKDYRTDALTRLAWHLRHCLGAGQAPDWASLGRLFAAEPAALVGLGRILGGMVLAKRAPRPQPALGEPRLP